MRYLVLASIFGVFSLGACEPSDQVQIKDIAWTPPKTSIPADYVSTAKKLLGNGLSDPRGGTFSRVTINIGNAAWDGVQAREAFGWVMPDGKHLVAVDGLTYDVVKDLGAATMAEFEKSKSGKNPSMDRAVPVASGNPAMPALLLVRGEVAQAELAYKQMLNTAMDDPLELYAHFINRYRMQVAQCLMDHKDKEALPYAEKIAAVGTLRVADNVNYPKDTFGWRLSDDEPLQILRDVTRRVQHPKGKLDLKAIEKLDQKARIAALIDALDEVEAKQFGQPGGLSWFGQPAIDGLAKECSAAVPALLDAMEKDDRLTRSVSYGRDFFPMRTIHSAREAAGVAVLLIWPSAETIPGETMAERVKNLREAWKVSGTLSEPERMLGVLRNDKAGQEAWLQASTYLTMPANVTRLGYMTAGNDQQSAEMKGESIRAKYGKEVSELMGKRAVEMSDIKEKSSSLDLHYAGNGLRLAHKLAKWDLKAAVPALIETSKNGLKVAKMWSESDEYVRDNLSGPFANVISDRLQAGDETAATDYAAMLESFRLGFSGNGPALKPLWTAAGNPAIEAIAAKIYGRELADMAAKDRKVREKVLESVNDLFRTPLIQSKTFRAFVAKLISDDEFAGTATAEQNQSYISARYSFGDHAGSGGMGLVKGIVMSDLVKDSTPFTGGEFVAQSAAGLKGAPPFAMVMLKEKRAEAKERMRAWFLDDGVDWASIVKDMHYYDDY